jgi:hypothetical protein
VLETLRRAAVIDGLPWRIATKFHVTERNSENA